MEENRYLHLANTLGGKCGSMTFTYLGLPLGTTNPALSDFLPVLTRNEKKLMVLNKLLTYPERLLIVNIVISALPAFYLCTLKVPATIIKHIDRYRMHGVWNSSGDVNRKGTSRV